MGGNGVDWECRKAIPFHLYLVFTPSGQDRQAKIHFTNSFCAPCRLNFIRLPAVPSRTSDFLAHQCSLVLLFIFFTPCYLKIRSFFWPRNVVKRSYNLLSECLSVIHTRQAAAHALKRFNMSKYALYTTRQRNVSEAETSHREFGVLPQRSKRGTYRQQKLVQ